MLILKIILSAILAMAAIIFVVLAAIYVHQAVQLLRFRWSMRSLANDDAREDDPALEVPELKGTIEEEKELAQKVWELFYRQGLSIAKLKASDRLRTQQAFTTPEVIQWQEWRGWQKLATRGSEKARKKSAAYARREAERQLQRLARGDIPLWLALYDEKEHPSLQLRWAQSNVRESNKNVALQMLEKLATRADEVGARALYELFHHYARFETRFKALEYAQRHLEHPHKHLEPSIRLALRTLFTPEIDDMIELGPIWTILAPRGANVVVRVHALDVNASEMDWLDDPTAPLQRAVVGETLWEHELPRPKWALLSRTARVFRLPNLAGPLQIEVSAQFDLPPLWSACMGEEKMPLKRAHRRLSNTSMEAVLSMTENSASTWIVDKKTKAPIPNIPLTLMIRDAQGKLETHAQVTDERGHFVWKGKGRTLWQLGVLIERENSQGRQERLFVTNGDDIKTSKAPTPIRRFYVFLARPLYRPGERVSGKLFARQKGHEGPSQKLSAHMVFRLELFSPRGTKVTSVSCTLSEFGTAPFEFQLPADAPLGKYTFRVADSTWALEGSFQVEEFVAPEFRAELRAKDKPRWGRPCAIEFEATYFFGGPVANASGTLDIKRANWNYRHFDSGSFSKWFRGPKHIASIPFKTNAQGRATIDVSWKGPWNLLRRFDGCDFSFAATVRDASGKSCEATLHLSVPRFETIVAAHPVRALRLPGETLPLRLSWEPADPTDETSRQLTIVCRKGWSKKTFVHQARRADTVFDLPIELPPGQWRVSAFVEGQTSRLRMKSPFTLLGSELTQKYRELIVSNDPSDNQGTIRVALMGPKTHIGYDLLIWNRGPRLGSKVIPRSGPTSWVELPYMPGSEEQVHLAWWYFDTREVGLLRQSATAEIAAVDLPNEAPTELTLVFPTATVRPGEHTSLEAKLGAVEGKPKEITVTVVDEAIFSIVAPPKSPRAFFEESPPRPEAYAAWSVVSASAQRGRVTEKPRPIRQEQNGPYEGGMPHLDELMEVQSRSMPMAAMPMMAAAPMDMVLAAPKSASPVRAAAAIAGAPVALVGAGAGLVADAVRRRSENADKNSALEQQEAGAMAAAPPVQLRSDFSSEAAWIPNTRWVRGTSLTVPIKLPETLTTWKASAVLVSLAHDHLLEAHARVRTQKPLMVRLQTPRFFQERDVLALRAMVDSRTEKALDVRMTLEAQGFVLPDTAQTSRAIEPHGQERIDVKITVPVCQTQNIVVRAQALATNVDDASDAEERTIPYRPYGVLLRKTFSGVLDEERTGATFELPTQRLKEFTSLELQIDRGPLDAVLTALSFLREYPYGCVEQTCSRLLPHLVWERLAEHNQSEDNAYRRAPKMPDDVVQETLRRITSMQNGNGGFGWWPGGKSDLWMTAYVLFTFALAEQPQSSNLEKARSYLTNHLLERDHGDDADAFAAFALVWTRANVTDRVAEVLLSRWDGLSLTEKAKFCWVLVANRHDDARKCAEEVLEALVGPAKRFLKKVAKEEDEWHLHWFHPGSTEAIAFFLLGLIRDRKADAARSGDAGQWFVGDDASSTVLVSFLLQHRQGKRWHNTRDTALAVMALLAYEEAVHGAGTERTIEVQINAETKRTVQLGHLDLEPVVMQFGDAELRVGKNEVSFVLSEEPARGTALHRHFSGELEFYTQEDEIAATGEGIEIERTYWLLDEKKEPKKRLRSGDKVVVGKFLRVVLKVKAAKARRYLLLEDFKLAGCEPIAKTSGRDVCRGHCAHVELRADRTAIFFDALGTDAHEVSYDIEAILPGRFTAMPARIETMYEAKCFATSASFGVEVGEARGTGS